MAYLRRISVFLGEMIQWYIHEFLKWEEIIMSVPIAVWIAAGLGAAGIKIYMDIRDVKQIVENAQAR